MKGEVVAKPMNLMSVTDGNTADGPFMPREGCAVSILRVSRFYATLCYALSGSLLASTLSQWHEPASLPVVLVSTIGAPLLPWVVAVEALLFTIFLFSNPPFGALTAGLFVTCAFLMRRRNVGWWIVILTLVPCTIVTAFALHAAGWVPKPTAPL